MNRFDCIDACTACHNLCSQEISRLIDANTPISLGEDAIEALIKCAAMCQTASKILRTHNVLAGAICVTCAVTCDQCAALLERYEGMQACVNAAKHCAECCRATSIG